METIKKSKLVVIIPIVLFVIVLALYLSKSGDSYTSSELILKNREVNEVVDIYVSEDDIPSYYLADYFDLLSNDFDEAYNRLDDYYKNASNIKNIKDFENYYKNNIFTLDYLSNTVSSYYIKYKNNYKYFFITDSSGHHYIFKEKSIMNYTIFLDKNKVDI